MSCDGFRICSNFQHFSFFDESSKTLNLVSLCSLLNFLCTADEDNLRNIDASSSKTAVDVIISGCGLPRISRLVSASVQGRPLSHQMRMWGTIKEHYVAVSFNEFTSFHIGFAKGGFFIES